jgi:hypothetical protein
MAELRSLVEQAVRNVSSRTLNLLPGAYFALGGAPLVCDAPINLSLSSSFSGATLDAEGFSRIIEVSNGCSLTTHRLVMLNGYSEMFGGAIYVITSFFTMHPCRISDCVAEEVWDSAQ